ncbi:WXG100 family type VII secretion target [Mycobacterium frederiksbergense]|uniref:WXG100 family type VII secretion target n=1 Tax=Mycolicibacterium frederiksbergense TaxID=117567 RepID=UPI0021F2DB5D|nr:WXG100 family type VII secretion target [Mycolicibacterium frederiksbergense]MCV7044719.1 WXG100 family type VII secretion target [Mycolicibacterium frederiksbergense]
MGVVGADVDQLRGLARSLTQASDRLDGMSGEVNNRLAATPWQGQDAQQFRSQWQGESQALIRSVVSALRAAAADVDRNANEQEQASAGTDSGGAPGTAGIPTPSLAPLGIPPAGLRFFPDLAIPDLFADPLAPFVDIRDFLGANAIWPINNGTALGAAIPGIGLVLPLLDALGIAGDTTLSPDDKIAEATHALTDLGGGILKGVLPGPVGYLSGVAVAQWGDVAHEVSKADFSPAAVKETSDYVASDPGGAFNAAKDAVLGYVPKLLSNLWK